MENIVTTIYPDGRKETREMTDEEIYQRNLDLESVQQQMDAEKQMIDFRNSAIISAKSKLKNLGLNDDEISALFNEMVNL